MGVVPPLQSRFSGDSMGEAQDRAASHLDDGAGWATSAVTWPRLPISSFCAYPTTPPWKIWYSDKTVSRPVRFSAKSQDHLTIHPENTRNGGATF